MNVYLEKNILPYIITDSLINLSLSYYYFRYKKKERFYKFFLDSSS